MVGHPFRRGLRCGGNQSSTAAPCKNAVAVSDLGDIGGSRQLRAAIACSHRMLSGCVRRLDA